jgi:hypothetical protein
LLDNLGGAEGPQESDENLAATKESEIGLAGYIIRAVAQYLNHDICRAEHGSTVRQNLRSFVSVSRVGVASCFSRARFDHDFESGLGEVWDHHGNQRHATFPRITLFRNPDDHAVLILSRSRIAGMAD